jgi:hypothetical protein
MTQAESITESLMQSLGFREPKEHTKWDEMVELVQSQVGDAETHDVAAIEMTAFVHYELANSWIKWLPFSELVMRIIVARAARKVERMQGMYELLEEVDYE